MLHVSNLEAFEKIVNESNSRNDLQILMKLLKVRVFSGAILCAKQKIFKYLEVTQNIHYEMN